MATDYELIIYSEVTIEDLRFYKDFNIFYNKRQAYLEDIYGNISVLHFDKNGHLNLLVSYFTYPRYTIYALMSHYGVSIAFLHEDDYYIEETNWESRREKDTIELRSSLKGSNWNKYYSSARVSNLPYYLDRSPEPIDERLFLDDLIEIE